MSGFFVRTASERDLGPVSALLSETWHQTYDPIYGAERVSEITDAWHGVETLRPRLGQTDAEFLVADDGATIGGMAFARRAAKDTKLVILHQLYVLPNLQRHGIGTELLNETAASFPEAKRVRVEVEEANMYALDFYRRYGFAETGRTSGELGFETVVLERLL